MNRKLRAYRQFKDLSQSEVADLLGISLHAYHNKESGKSDFSLREAKILADLFNVTIDDIFFNDNVPELGTKTTA